MKFSCGRCGKRYATAETPAPGRVYKIRCKACGDLIVVKSEGAQRAGAEELGPAVMLDLAYEQGAPTPDPRSVTFELGVPEQHLETPLPAGSESPPPLPLPEPVLEDLPAAARTERAEATGTAAAISAVGLHAALAEEPTSPGYVDLFSDAARGDDDGSAPARGQASTDPFLAAARASLPDGFGAGAPRAAHPEGFRAPERQQVAVPAPAAKLPVIAKPPQQKRAGPLVLIGIGALVVVGILAFVLLGGQPPSAPPPHSAGAPPPQAAPPPQVVAAPPPQAAAPAPVMPAPAVAAPAAAPAAAGPPSVVVRPEPAEPPRPEKRAAATVGAREDRRARDRAAAAARDSRDRGAAEREAAAAREASARDDREAQERDRIAREAQERDRIAREARAREERDAQERERAEQARQEQQQVAAASLGEPAEALTQDQVQKVLSSSRKAFDGCIANAGKSSAVALDGRRVMLRLNIQPSGSVTYPTLDDVTLNATDLGSCLKSAARVMVFPRFKGDPMHVELPLVLAAPAR